ncbi:hypothetical protein EJB05_43248 [Eragrostis curvula]|uniref:Uncharacterized protein n=1 Tax=Eragrostis curvula TaxID=38414 RepID=A0A5J9TED5_9POAL|nr:hypothetical protein EJB05_43248 [Eragrostis curvula]
MKVPEAARYTVLVTHNKIRILYSSDLGPPPPPCRWIGIPVTATATSPISAPSVVLSLSFTQSRALSWVHANMDALQVFSEVPRSPSCNYVSVRCICTQKCFSICMYSAYWPLIVALTFLHLLSCLISKRFKKVQQSTTILVGTFVESSLMNACEKCGEIWAARKVYDRSRVKRLDLKE